MPRNCCHLLLLAVFAAVAPVAALAAPQDITSLATTITTGSGNTTADTGNLTYENSVRSLTGFLTAGGSYSVVGAADNATVQRSGTPNQSSVWYVQGAGTNLKGVHQDAYGTMLRSNNFYEGADNVFTNGAALSAGNIERLDFTWNTPLVDLDNKAFAIFDRGVAGAHDAFIVALITHDASGNLAYAAALRVGTAWGAANVVSDQTYNLFRYDNGDNITAATQTSEFNTQGVGGIVVKVSDFGTLTAGTQIYGYSLMAADVDISDLSKLTNVNDAAVYPAGTADANGGIDLAAVNGLQFQLVPEPGTVALLLLGIGFLAVRKARRQRLA